MFTKRLDHMKAVARPQNLRLLQQLGCFYSTKKQQQHDVQQPQNQQQQQQQQPQKEVKQQQQQQQQQQQEKQQQHEMQLPQQQQQQQESKLPLGKGDEDEKGAISEVECLTQQLAAVKVEHNDLLEKYKRALADGENMRKRLNKQIDEARIFGIQGFCKDLIDVADVLGHATESVAQEKLKANADLKNLYEGLNLTRASLLQVFKRHGLETLDPINEKFDPNMHEALFQTQDDSVEANTVVQVTKLGYKLHKRCIRPALVGVSKR